jgi:two-component system chemotaxis response regulator CheY
MAIEEITKRGVLIADSSAHMASLVAVMLRGLGRKDIREAYDAGRAMLEVRRRIFDIIIIDDALDGMDGVAFTKKLRAATDCQNRLVPIIMMSAAPDAKRIAEARDAGVTEFLRKPFAANHLQTRLNSIEANPRGFIEAAEYKGPDRRRKVVDVGEDRREAEKAPKAG